jgi:hypothetical protein
VCGLECLHRETENFFSPVGISRALRFFMLVSNFFLCCDERVVTAIRLSPKQRTRCVNHTPFPKADAWRGLGRSEHCQSKNASTLRSVTAKRVHWSRSRGGLLKKVEISRKVLGGGGGPGIGSLRARLSGYLIAKYFDLTYCILAVESDRSI